MKLKILSIDFPLDGKGIENYSFHSSPSVSDYDAVIIDPQNISNLWVGSIRPRDNGSLWTDTSRDKGFGNAMTSFMTRKKEELEHLLRITKGVVICILRDYGQILNVYKNSYDSWAINRYSWLPNVISANFIQRQGKEIRIVNKYHPFAQYMRALKDSLHFEAVLERNSRMLPIATNKVGELIAIEYPIGDGKLIFLPPLNNHDPEKVGGVLTDCLRGAFRWSASSMKPNWVAGCSLPGEEEILAKVKELDDEILKIEGKKKALKSEHERFEMLKGLLFEQGKYGLEPPVRTAFKLLGFNVLDPEKYEEEYDLLAKEDDLLVIGEIEGSEAQVDLAKYRQLLDYVDREETANGNKVKGILVGNGFIKKNPEERCEQFTDAAIRGCKSRKFCRITTYELYKAVQAVLGGVIQKEEIKKHILNDEFKLSMVLETEGIFCGN